MPDNLVHPALQLYRRREEDVTFAISFITAGVGARDFYSVAALVVERNVRKTDLVDAQTLFERRTIVVEHVGPKCSHQDLDERCDIIEARLTKAVTILPASVRTVPFVGNVELSAVNGEVELP